MNNTTRPSESMTHQHEKSAENPTRAFTLHLRGRADELDGVAQSAKDSLVSLISEAPLGEAFDFYNDFEDSVEALEKSVKKLSALCSLAREVLLPERMDTEKVPTVNTDRIRATRTSRVLASIRSDNREGAYNWLRATGYDSLIKEQVNASSLSALAKELMSQGKELPEDHFSVHLKDGVSITVKRK